MSSNRPMSTLPDLSEDELHPGPDDEETDLILQTVFGEDSTC